MYDQSSILAETFIKLDGEGFCCDILMKNEPFMLNLIIKGFS